MTSKLEALKARAEQLTKTVQGVGPEIADANTALANAATAQAREKAHQRIETATRLETRSEDELALVRGQIEQIEADEAAKVLEAKWDEANRRGLLWLNTSEELRAKLRELVQLYKKLLEDGDAFRAALPEITRSDKLDMYWLPQRMQIAFDLQLFMESEGTIKTRFAGATTPWELRQGPDLVARVRENTARAMSRRPAVDRSRHAA